METSTEQQVIETELPKTLTKAVLEFQNRITLVEGLRDTVEVAILLNEPSGVSLIAVKYEQNLFLYRFHEGSKTVTLLDAEFEVFATNVHHRQWWFPKKGLIVAQNGKSVKMYRLNDTKDRFDFVIHLDASDYADVLLGNFFGDTQLDALVRDRNTWKFKSYNSTWSDQNVEVPVEMKEGKCEVQVISDFGTDKDVFVIKTVDNLGVYQINESKTSEQIVKCMHIKFQEDAEFDQIAFAKFSDAKFKDLLHFNTTGLNVYRFNDTTGNYEPHLFSTMFSKFRNWNADLLNSVIVQDMDGDGRDELLFMAPTGFQVFRAVEANNEFYLEQVIMKSEKDVHRFLNLKTILRKKQNEACAVFHDGEKLYLMDIKKDTMTITLAQDIEPKNVSSQITLITPTKKYSRWLHEHLDLSELLQPLNSLTGKVELCIPLVQLDNPFGISVRKSFQYRDIVGDDYLARGWTFPLDYIAVDRRGSIFEHDFRYFLVGKNFKITLSPNFEKSTNHMLFFEVKPDVVLTYFKNEQKWEMENQEESMKYIFGTFGSTVGLRYKELGENGDVEQRAPIEWYLVREEDASGSFVEYQYNIDLNSVNLERISTDQESTVQFNYENKKMKSFEVETQFYKQHVILETENKDDKDYLTGIKQDNYPLFEFEYDAEKMVKIVYPNGLSSTLEYGEVIIDIGKRNELELVSENFIINYGPDYSVIVVAAPDKNYVQVNVRDVLGGSHTPKTFNDTLINDQEPFTAYQVVILENLFGTIRTFRMKKVLNLFKFTDDTWNKTEQQLSPDAIITSNINTIYIADAGLLQTITLGTNDTLIYHTQNITSNFAMHATNRGLLFYDDQKFVLQYTPNSQYLKGKYKFYDNNYIKSTYEALNRFMLTDEVKANLMRALKLGMIQTFKNYIILRALEISNGNMKIRLRLKELSGDNEIVDSNQLKVDLGAVENFKLNVTSTARDSCTLGYIIYLEKYATTIRCSGPSVELYENIFRSEMKSAVIDTDKVGKTMNAITKFSNYMAAFEEIILGKNPVAFDVSLLTIYIDEHVIKTGGKMIDYNESNWSQWEPSLDEGFILRDKLKLMKRSGDTYKIYNDTDVLYDSKTTDSGSVKLVWPYYFASQATNGPPSLYLFNNGTVVTLNKNEKLSAFSNKMVIVTTSDNNSKLLLLPAQSLEDPKVDVLVKQTLELSQKVSRITTYENGGIELDGLSNGYVFTNSKILPGGNKTKYGWYQHSYDLKARELRRSVRDSDGNLIKYIDPEVEEPHESPNPATVITDKAGRLSIVDIAPKNVQDGEFLYYGFEEYERIAFNDTLRWTYDDKKLKIEGGNRFLQLESKDAFEGVLRMKSANEKYLFSCWLKTDTPDKINELLSFERVNQDEEQMYQVGQPKVQHAIATGWFYVELVITTLNLVQPTSVNVKINPQKDKILNVDHVRFSPLNVDFRAYIYRRPFWGVSRVMHNSGLLTQYLLDSHGNRVVYVSELGKVTDFITYSKSYNIRGSEMLPHVMEIRPRNGEIECFNNPSTWTPKIEQTSWTMQSGTLTHIPNSADTIKRDLSSDCDSFVVRFVYNLNSTDAAIKLVIDDLTTIDVLCKSSKTACETNKNISDYGEIVVFISKTHRAVWFEGSLATETAHSMPGFKTVGLSISGSVAINEMLVLYDPSMKITYYNRLGLPRQTLTMQDENFIRIKEVLYDEIDRSIVTTKWTTVKKDGNLFFDFHKKFIESVESNQLRGLVHDLNEDCEGYPYFRKDYANSPITEEVTISMPGKIFSEDTKYSRQLARQSKYNGLEKLFPSAEGFTQQVEIRQNKTFHVVVNDANNRKVAYFVAADSSDERLTTYEYDSDGNLILELPPMYHNASDTLKQIIPFWGKKMTQSDLQLQAAWGVRYTYNDKGQLLSKRMPDSGTQQYFYDDDVVRFLVHMDNSNKTDKTIYFAYGPTGKIVKEAVVDIASSEFSQYLGDSTLLPDSKNYVEYYHGEYDESPSMRHRSQQSIRRIDDKHMIESLINDHANRIVKKIYIVPTLNTSYAIDYEYLNDKLSMIRYPIAVNGSDFKVSYAYNNAGDMTAIGTRADPEKFVKLQYNADGLVREMQFEPGSTYSYKREYSYNEPGYLKRISDMFLEENVSYLEADGYGNAFSMIFEGLISRTTFNATWFERSNPALSKLWFDDMGSYNRTLAAFCIKQLQLKRYYNKHLHPMKSFYPKLDGSISEACRSKQFRKAFHVNEYPQYYGHSYDYDNHEQLIRAKYFQSPTEASWKPLVENSFSKIKGIDETVSKQIWKILTDNDFVSNNCYHDGICEGLPGNRSLLNTLIPDKSYVQAFVLKSISKMKTLSDEDFSGKCLKWFENTENCERIDCTEWAEKLQTQNMIGTHSNKTWNALNHDFHTALVSYSQFIPQIVRELHQHFATRLGESPADVLSCRFDANGNHRLFRKGSVRYSFEYTSGTNQINTIIKTETDDPENSSIAYKIEHNSEGSVTIAQHKNIEKIDYDPLLNRPASIHMNDGRKLKFEYDVRGERTFKQVIEKDGNVSKEKYYIRDLNRNVLVDLQLTYVAKNKTPDIQVTSYVYSDQGLVGFVRNDEFYSVFTDHEGSTRLVIKDGEVKAAYDYLPFGIIFRKSERDLDGTISYLYTGQEWDEETGLYNYHTRLYDPEIGRFYQIDPKSQYASPYIYAGNSPIGLIDPDGQFFMTLIAIALALVGAYLGAAAANGSWNPVDWNWKSANTWLGLFSGALAGATLPSSAVATFTYLTATLGLSVSTSLSIMIGSGIGLSYLSMAAANNDWNPEHWDMKSPATWNAFFAGVATSVSVITNPHNLASSYSAITSAVGKGLFIGGKLILTTGFAYMLGVIQQNGEFDPTKWDFSKPGLYMSLFSGAVRATSTVRFISNLPENIKSVFKKVGELISSKQLTMTFLNLKQHLGSDWPKQLVNTRHFLNAYSGNLKAIGKGSFNVLLYTTVSSLRICKIVEKDKVPQLGIAIEIIKQIEGIGSISDYMVNNLYLTEYPQIKAEPYRRTRSIMENAQYNSTSSGASSFSRSILNFFFFRFGLHNPPETSSPKEMNAYSARTKSSDDKVYSIPNCFQLYAAENETPSIKCYGQHSQISIQYKTYQGEITQDRFQSCYPLYYNDIPSVSCEGTQSSLLFTAYETPRFFDYVDGWILLARVMPTAIKNIVSGLRGVFGCLTIPSKPVLEAELISMRNDYAGLEDLVTFCDGSRWARKAIDELNEDLTEFLNEPTKHHQTYGVLKERIAALRDDVLEDIEFDINADQLIPYFDEIKSSMFEVSQSMDVRNLMQGMQQYPNVGLLD